MRVPELHRAVARVVRVHPVPHVGIGVNDVVPVPDRVHQRVAVADGRFGLLDRGRSHCVLESGLERQQSTGVGDRFALEPQFLHRRAVPAEGLRVLRILGFGERRQRRQRRRSGFVHRDLPPDKPIRPDSYLPRLSQRRDCHLPRLVPLILVGWMNTPARRSAAITRSYSSQSSWVPPAAVKISLSSRGRSA